MPSELFGTSVIFVKVAPTYVERTLTALRAKSNVTKAESVFGRHDIAIAGGFRNTDELRAFASEVQLMDHITGLRSYPALWDWTNSKKDGHASNAYLLIRSTDTQKTMSALKNVPEIQEIIGTTGDSDIVARISADPRENLLESVVTKVQGMPSVRSTETLPAFSKYYYHVSWTGPIRFVPLFVLDLCETPGREIICRRSALECVGGIGMRPFAETVSSLMT